MSEPDSDTARDGASVGGEASRADRPAATPSRGAGRKPVAVVLARHGRPALDRALTLTWREYKTWWDAYQIGGLADDQEPPEELLAEARAADVVFASPLARSLETARHAAPGRAIVTDPVFVEAPLPPPPLAGLRLKPTWWGVVARISWWLGFAGGEETRPEAERRAEAAVDRVLKEADAGRSVLVCAHGWFNRMMRPVLIARGWRCVRDGRDHYWSFRRYERR